MIESPVYEFIKEEGRKEGRKEGLYDAISLGLELKFGVEGVALMDKVQKIDSMEKLEIIKEAVKFANSAKEIEKLI